MTGHEGAYRGLNKIAMTKHYTVYNCEPGAGFLRFEILKGGSMFGYLRA